MNIFFLDVDARRCARMHVDKHVIKMILETAQMLCTVWHATTTHEYTPPYKRTHVNHPCSVWARASIDNYRWLCDLGMALCKEYTHRYGKTHKTQAVIQDLCTRSPSIPEIGFTSPAQAMPEEYKADSVVHAYRNYYLGEKSHMFKWTKRDAPLWCKHGHSSSSICTHPQHPHEEERKMGTLQIPVKHTISTANVQSQGHPEVMPATRIAPPAMTPPANDAALSL